MSVDSRSPVEQAGAPDDGGADEEIGADASEVEPPPLFRDARIGDPSDRIGAAATLDPTEAGNLVAAFATHGDDHGAPGGDALVRFARIADITDRPARRRKGKVWTTYKERVALLSEAIVRAQKPIRILDAVKWGEDVARKLIRTNFTELPVVGPKYYARIPLRFDPELKVEEFERIKSRVRLKVGEDDALGKILIQTCEQYQQVVRMLQARGTREFYKHSRDLYGTPKEKFIDDTTTIRDMGQILYEMLDPLEERDLGDTLGGRTLSAQDCVDILNERFTAYFHDHHVHARLDDGIVSDAAAGADYIKVKKGVMFSRRDVDILEVHEGWAHVGTTINGQVQRVASWLAKGPPRTTSVQEGLAVLLEIFTFNSQPSRAKKLNNRILACDKAEDGANLLDVIEFYRTEGYSEVECLTNAQRVFRGGVVKGRAPFTKDISYCKGFIQNYNFMRTCIKYGRPELIPFLFVGKVALEDIPVLYQKWREGVIDRPKYVPRPFRDLNVIAMWMAYSNFFNKMNLQKIQENLRPSILGA